MRADTGVWTKVTTTPNIPSARFALAGGCLDPIMGGVLVFIGGCNKYLDSVDDMYYLHTGGAKNLTFPTIQFTDMILVFL